MSTNLFKRGLLSLTMTASVAGALVASAPSAQAQATTVYVNGQPLSLPIAPMQQNGRLLVPMRAIFRQLGAQVGYNDLTQAIVARRGTTTVTMALGSREAKVNGQRVLLDAPATAYSGNTMVPLRFVSEAMGATVDYNPVQRYVNIKGVGGGRGLAGRPGGGSQVGGYRQISIPANSVVPVTIDQRLSSADASVGQTFTATVVSEQLGDSEFPAGTRLQGRVNDVQRRNGDNPGVLGLVFTSAVLPDGQRVNMRGDLIALDNDNVTNQNGRIVAKGSSGGGNDSLKVIGIGAGAGYLVGRLLKKDGLVSGLIGAAGGYLYDRSRDRNKAREAVLDSGTRLGVRLRNGVTYQDTTNYYQRRTNYVPLS